MEPRDARRLVLILTRRRVWLIFAVFAGRRRLFNFNRGAIRDCVATGDDDWIARIDSADNLNQYGISDAELHDFLVGFLVGPRDEHVGSAFRVLEDRV